MPFIVIEGTYHLVGRNGDGQEAGFQPDGDSLHFKPANPALLNRLTRLERPYRLSRIGSIQLRFEGIDALELHFSPGRGRPDTRQPPPLAEQARDFLTGQLGLNPVPYAPPRNITVKPPVRHDGAPGYILSRSLEVHGRPVSFAFAGPSPATDGADVFLTVDWLKRSLNYKLIQSGNAYPLFYETLFVDLRNALAAAARQARAGKRGLWGQDRSQTGVAASSQGDLEREAVIFPKLFRRLSEYFAQPNGGLDGFLPWLEATREQVQDLTTTNFTHFENVVSVQDNMVHLTRLPEQLVFISAK
jgi:endonuclease YncB( thermonuclease family)